MVVRCILFGGAVIATGLVLCLLACAGPPAGSDSSPASPAAQEAGAAKGPAVERNAGCCMCHQPFLTEALSLSHAEHGIACADCHGPSVAHSTDERFQTPPEVTFESNAVDPFCRNCHKEHDVPPANVVQRWLEVRSAGEDRVPNGTPARCTVCHGRHRLAGVSAFQG